MFCLVVVESLVWTRVKSVIVTFESRPYSVQVTNYVSGENAALYNLVSQIAIVVLLKIERIA